MLTFEQFSSKLKTYDNINNIVDGEKIDFYQVPFELGVKETCIKKDDWVLCLSNHYVYDYIKDEDISKALKEDLSNIDISKDWTNSISGFENAYTNKESHTKRIAKIVQSLLNKEELTPISMFFDDRAYSMDCKNYIEDGNHRIRALQYLKYDCFPAYIYGNFSKELIDHLK